MLLATLLPLTTNIVAIIKDNNNKNNKISNNNIKHFF